MADLAAWIEAGSSSFTRLAAAAVAGVGASGVQAALRALLGDGAAVGAVTVSPESTHIRLERVRVPIARGAVAGEIVLDASLALGALLGGRVAASLERITARVTLRGAGARIALTLGFEPESEGVSAPGVVASGRLWAVADVAPDDDAARAVTLRVSGRVLVDDARAYVHALELAAPGVALRGDGSVARDGTALRARAEGEVELARFLRSLAVPEGALPRADAPLRVAIDASGSLAAPHAFASARGAELHFPMGRPRWVPAERIDALEVRATLDAAVISLEATARSGEGLVALHARKVLGTTEPSVAAPRVRVELARWPARWIEAVRALVAPRTPSLADTLAGGTLDGTASLGADEASPWRGAVTITTRASGVLRVDGRLVAPNALELRATSPRLALALDGNAGQAGQAVSLDDVDAVLRVTRARDALRGAVTTVRLGSFVARTFGGQLAAEGGATFGPGAGPEADGELRVRLEGGGPELLAALASLGPASPLRVTCGPPAAGAERPRGEAWLSPRVKVGAEVRVVSMVHAAAHVAPSIDARITATSPQTDLVLELRRDAGGHLDARLDGSLGLGEAVDLGLFDGGPLPDRTGVLALAVTLAGAPDGLAFSGALGAPSLAFGSRLALEDVRALVSVHRGVAVWSDVHARLAGGRVTLEALVDRAGALGGACAHVVLEDVDVAVLSGGVAEGRLDLEIALEQHGPEDAPLLGEGALVLRAGAIPDLARRASARLAASVAARNARARGEVRARVVLDGTAVRLLDLVVPLRDAWVRGDVRFGPHGDVDAHLDVHARELVLVPVRVRGGLGAAAPELDVDVLSAAFVGAVAARARTRGPRSRMRATRPATVPKHEALTRAVTAIDWVALSRRARRQS